MGNIVKIEWNNAGFQNLLKEDGVQKLVRDSALQMADLASSMSGGEFDFEMQEGYCYVYRGRPLAIVYAADNKAIKAESEMKILNIAAQNMRVL